MQGGSGALHWLYIHDRVCVDKECTAGNAAIDPLCRHTPSGYRATSTFKGRAGGRGLPAASHCQYTCLQQTGQQHDHRYALQHAMGSPRVQLALACSHRQRAGEFHCTGGARRRHTTVLCNSLLYTACPYLTGPARGPAKACGLLLVLTPPECGSPARCIPPASQPPLAQDVHPHSQPHAHKCLQQSVL